MHIKQITLHNYRNLNLQSTVLNELSNLIIAPNGSGKTNLIESIYLASSGTLFRSYESISQIIKSGEDFMKINIDLEDDQIEIVVSVTTNKLTKKYFINGKTTTAQKVRQKVPTILFAPTSVDLVSNEPALRRNDLDHYISLLNIEYSKNISSYTNIVRNRNALIKLIRENRATKKELDFWTEKLVNLCDKIYQKRKEVIDELNQIQPKVIDELIQSDPNTKIHSFKIVYTPNSEPPIQIGYLENLKSKFETNYTKELVVGKTLYGIHKDDYKFILNDISDLRYLGSRGQQRIGILLLKLAQIKLYGLKAEIKPIFLIDDVMSELDSENRKSVAELVLQSGSQIFLTSADLNEIPPLLNERSSLIRLSE